MDADIEPEIAEYPEAGPFWVGLWAVARHWVGLLEQTFAPDILATTGITRSLALRAGKWLWAIEGLIRRLIIAAAMKLDVSQLPARIERRPKPAKPREASASIAFAVLPRLPGRRPERPRPACAAPTQEHRHIVFPGDDLLNLFPRHNRRNARPVHIRHPDPLHRRGRRSRWDPDYQGGSALICENGVTYGAFSLHGRSAIPLAGRAPPPPRPRANSNRKPPRRWWPGDGVPEWNRVELEWQRIIPAPRIAGRINALLRVLQAPERWVERTARRLHADADLVTRLRNHPPPYLRKHRHDRGADPPLLDELARAHALRLDTS